MIKTRRATSTPSPATNPVEMVSVPQFVSSSVGTLKKLKAFRDLTETACDLQELEVGAVRLSQIQATQLMKLRRQLLVT